VTLGQGPSLPLPVGGATDRGRWTMETPAWPHHAAPGDPVITLKMAEIRRWKCNGTRPWRMSCGTTRKVTTLNGGKGRQWGNGNGESSQSHAAWKPDSGNTTRVLGAFPPMDNGEHLPTQGEPGDASHFITDYCWAGGWAMENGGRSPPAASRARDPGGMTNWARPMRLLRQWNGQWPLERWRVTSEGGSGPR